MNIAPGIFATKSIVRVDYNRNRWNILEIVRLIRERRLRELGFSNLRSVCMRERIRSRSARILRFVTPARVQVPIRYLPRTYHYRPRHSGNRLCIDRVPWVTLIICLWASVLERSRFLSRFWHSDLRTSYAYVGILEDNRRLSLHATTTLCEHLPRWCQLTTFTRASQTIIGEFPTNSTEHTRVRSRLGGNNV